MSQDGKKSHKGERKRKAVKWIRAARYDKSSLSAELRDAMPPALDDIVEFDVVQSRRTMQVAVENLTIIERKNPEAVCTDVSETSGIGVVSEVVTSRNFGF